MWQSRYYLLSVKARIQGDLNCISPCTKLQCHLRAICMHQYCPDLEQAVSCLCSHQRCTPTSRCDLHTMANSTLFPNETATRSPLITPLSSSPLAKEFLFWSKSSYDKRICWCREIILLCRSGLPQVRLANQLLTPYDRQTWTQWIKNDRRRFALAMEAMHCKPTIPKSSVWNYLGRPLREGLGEETMSP